MNNEILIKHLAYDFFRKYGVFIEALSIIGDRNVRTVHVASVHDWVMAVGPGSLQIIGVRQGYFDRCLSFHSDRVISREVSCQIQLRLGNCCPRDRAALPTLTKFRPINGPIDWSFVCLISNPNETLNVELKFSFDVAPQSSC